MPQKTPHALKSERVTGAIRLFTKVNRAAIRDIAFARQGLFAAWSKSKRTAPALRGLFAAQSRRYSGNRRRMGKVKPESTSSPSIAPFMSTSRGASPGRYTVRICVRVQFPAQRHARINPLPHFLFRFPARVRRRAHFQHKVRNNGRGTGTICLGARAFARNPARWNCPGRGE